MLSKRSFALVGTGALVLSMLPGVGMAQAQVEKQLDHLVLSADQVKDSVEISALWAAKVGKADHVLVTTDAVFADSLASGALQGALKAPLLFIDTKVGVDAQTIKTITSLGASKVTVLGGDQAVSPALVDALKKINGVKTVDRISGASRVETSVAIAERVGAKDDTVIVARADNYADSLAAGALAARTGYPVLLNTNPFKDANGVMVNVHPALEAYLKKNQIKKILVAGGPEAVADASVAALKTMVSDTSRVAGQTRRETAVALAKLWSSTGKVTVVDGFAQSNGFHNGFAAALSAANLGAPVVLANKGEALSKGEAELVGPGATGVTGYCGTYVDSKLCTHVAERQGARVVVSKLENRDAPAALTVTPTDKALLISNGKTPVNRQYVIRGAQEGKDYTIKLAKAKRDEKGNIVLDNGTDGKPVDSNTNLSISVVNGASSGAKNNVVVKPVSGEITFTVEAAGDVNYGLVIPVVMVKDGEQDKIVTQAGPVVVSPPELPNGTLLSAVSGNNNDWIIKAVHKEERFIVIANGDKQFTMKFDENDKFYTSRVKDNYRIDLDGFLKELSINDAIGGNNSVGVELDSIYYQSPLLSSTIVYKDLAPVPPSVTTSFDIQPTSTSVGIRVEFFEPGATLTVKIAKLGEKKGISYQDDPSKFTITRTFTNVQPGANRSVHLELKGLDPSSHYDVAVAQTVNGELSGFSNLGSVDGTSTADVLSTTVPLTKIGIANVQRVQDPVNDGLSYDPLVPGALKGNTLFKVTLDSDRFDGGMITPENIVITPTSGGVIIPLPQNSTSSELDDTGLELKAAGYDKVGTSASGESKVFYVKFITPLIDAEPDVEYVLKLKPTALKSADNKALSDEAAFTFKY